MYKKDYLLKEQYQTLFMILAFRIPATQVKVCTLTESTTQYQFTAGRTTDFSAFVYPFCHTVCIAFALFRLRHTFTFLLLCQ